MDVYRDSDLRKMNPGLVAVKVYIASNSRHAPRWSVLRAAGVPFISTWIDWPFNTLPVLLILRPLLGCAHWTKCCDEAAAADILLFVDLPGETRVWRAHRNGLRSRERSSCLYRVAGDVERLEPSAPQEVQHRC